MIRKIRVMCVDDSALIRALMKEIINAHPDMEVVGVAPDPLIARRMIKELDPDVLTLDVEMPKMDGIEFLEKIMRLRPMPVVMVSSLTQRGGEITLRALALGAVDFVTKPEGGIRDGMREYSDMIADKIRAAAAARVGMLRRTPTVAPQPNTPEVAARFEALARATSGPLVGSEKVVFIGASTGGTEAILNVLSQLPSNMPATLVTQHMPAGFTTSFAHRLDQYSQMRVSEACDGERVLPGHAYLAPGGATHMQITRSGANFVIALSATAPVNRHRPSVDVLFHSAAVVVGRNAVGVILTGMGRDGAAGLLEMRRAGAHTIAQDEATSLVYGMPREALVMGGVDDVLPLPEIAARLVECVGPRVYRV